MGDAKRIRVEPISARDGNRVIQSLHYSGKVVKNSQLHLGVFLDGKCGGALQFGPSLDKSKIVGLVEGTGWNEFIELNRMAFADWLPRNSESRAIAYSMRFLRKNYPHLKWVISFADASQCGDGTIYRASGFVLTAIHPTKNLCRLPNGDIIHKMTLASSPDVKRPELGNRSYYDITGGKYTFDQSFADAVGGEILPGFQIRYIYFLDPDCRSRLVGDELPYSAIEEAGAAMYKGERIERGRQ